jgi:hypothetical protein
MTRKQPRNQRDIRRKLNDLETNPGAGATPARKVYAGIDPTALPGLPDDLDPDARRVQLLDLDGEESVEDAVAGSQVVGWSPPDTSTDADTEGDG